MRRARLIGTLAGIVIVVLFVYLLARQTSYIQENVSFRSDLLGALVGLSLMVFLLRAVMNRVIFSPLGVKLSTLHWLGIVMAGTLANTLPFAAGSFAKGFYLKRIHKLPYRIFAGGQIALFALVVCTNGLVGLFLLATFFRDQASPVVWGLFALMTCAGLVLLLPKTLQRFLGEERFPWPEWSTRQRTMAWFAGGLGQIGILLLLAGRLHLCFAMGLEQVSYSACVLFGASIAITRLAAITPASIGVREFMIGAIAYLIGFEFRDALIASTIDRVVDLLVVGFLTPLFGVYFKKTVLRETSEDSQPETSEENEEYRRHN